MRYSTANIFDNLNDDIIAHQCNCTYGMFTGFAKQVAERFNVFEMDESIRKQANKFPEEVLGTAVKVHDNIYNLYSQYFIGEPKIGFDTFQQRCNLLLKALNQLPTDKQIRIPLIASGLAADKKLKAHMNDFEYFKKFIEPIISNINPIIKNHLTIYHSC